MTNEQAITLLEDARKGYTLCVDTRMAQAISLALDSLKDSSVCRLDSDALRLIIDSVVNVVRCENNATVIELSRQREMAIQEVRRLSSQVREQKFSQARSGNKSDAAFIS